MVCHLGLSNDIDKTKVLYWLQVANEKTFPTIVTRNWRQGVFTASLTSVGDCIFEGRDVS